LFPLDHRVKLGQGMVGWVGSHGQKLLANDVRAEPHYTNYYPDLIPTQSELAVPIRVGEETVGVLDVQSPHLDAFQENDVIVMETLADQIAVAIENARLYEAVQRELAERKWVEEKLGRYSADLAQSNEELKHFNYTVSHDLRAPLVNLKGFAAELISSVNVIRPAFEPLLPQVSERQRAEVSTILLEDMPEALSFIDASVTRMDHFINALLKLSRLGRRELNLERVNMNALVRSALEILAHQIKQRQVQVTVGLLPEVMADRTSMEQSMNIILDNAILYLEPDRPGEIEITGERNANEATFRIRDNGRGIAQEDMDKVFAPFRRAGKQDVPGEGMGLAYVQALIRRHGGRIWCESELGVGTTFAFSLSNHLARASDPVK
jgi:signal transduction histidine kinase